MLNYFPAWTAGSTGFFATYERQRGKVKTQLKRKRVKVSRVAEVTALGGDGTIAREVGADTDVLHLVVTGLFNLI